MLTKLAQVLVKSSVEWEQKLVKLAGAVVLISAAVAAVMAAFTPTAIPLAAAGLPRLVRTPVCQGEVRHLR